MLKTAPRLGSETVTIIIATFQRPRKLRTVLDNLNSQLCTRHQVKACIVDNNPLPQEKHFVETFQARAEFPVKYIHEPAAGVSNARNAGMAQVDTRFVAFLDDDMEITDGWLDGLIETALDHETGLVFGPVEAKFPDKAKALTAYLSPFYSRLLQDGLKGEIHTTFGTGGCLIDLSVCQVPNPPFDTNLNESGGEDDIFFDHLRETGTRVGYAPSALSYEIVPEGRISPRYIIKRNFGYGQGPSRISAASGRKGWVGIARHMVTGSVQFTAYGALYFSHM